MPSCGPIYALIVVSADTGSRAIFVDPASIKPLEPAGLRSEWFQGAKVLMVDHLYPAAILPAVRMARQLGLQVVSDIEMEMPQLAEIRAGIDHFICSAEFAVPYTGGRDPRAACEMLSRSAPHRTVVVTAGQDGCYWCTHDQSAVKHVPAHRIERGRHDRLWRRVSRRVSAMGWRRGGASNASSTSPTRLRRSKRHAPAAGRPCRRARRSQQMLEGQCHTVTGHCDRVSLKRTVRP